MENATWEAADKALREERINLRHYWHVILERRWLVIAAYCSVFALCLIYLFKATRIYQATTRIQIDRDDPKNTTAVNPPRAAARFTRGPSSPRRSTAT